MGSLRSRHQLGHVRFHHLQVNAAVAGTFCLVAQDDGQVAWRNRRNWRTTMLQARFLPVHPDSHRFCQRAFWYRDGKATRHLSLLQLEQPVHRTKVSVLKSKPMNQTRLSGCVFFLRVVVGGDGGRLPWPSAIPSRFFLGRLCGGQSTVFVGKNVYLCTSKNANIV